MIQIPFYVKRLGVYIFKAESGFYYTDDYGNATRFDWWTAFVFYESE